MNIQFATIQDIKECHEVDQKMEGKFKTKNFIFKEAQNGNRLIVAKEKEKIIGYLLYNFFETDIPFVSVIRVLPEFRQKGFGQKMYEFVERKLRKEGYKFLVSSTDDHNPNSLIFHKKLGFKECGSVKFTKSETEIFLKKNL